MSAALQQARLLRLAAALPAIDLVVSQDEGDVVCAWSADRRDIEIVAAKGGRRAYDAWMRPRGPILQQRYDISLIGGKSGSVIDEPGLRLVRSSMTLKEAAAWVTEALRGRVEVEASGETRLYDEVASALRSMRERAP